MWLLFYLGMASWSSEQSLFPIHHSPSLRLGRDPYRSSVADEPLTHRSCYTYSSFPSWPSFHQLQIKQTNTSVFWRGRRKFNLNRIYWLQEAIFYKSVLQRPGPSCICCKLNSASILENSDLTWTASNITPGSHFSAMSRALCQDSGICRKIGSIW